MVQSAGLSACETVTVCPATVSVPILDPPVLAAHVNATVPVPDPLPPEVTVIQDALLVAVQLQDAAVVTVAASLPAEAAT